MKQHPPYTEADWRADCERKAQGEPLTCLDCGFSGDYHGYGPRGGERGPHYRACKECGFWQEVADAYRCWTSTHTCDPGLDGAYDCEHCEQTELVGPHDCGKYLKPWQDGYPCRTCGQRLGRETEAPWPRLGSG